MAARRDAVSEQAEAGSMIEVGGAFLKLGLSSFGGPIAHLGYFRREFVERRRWLDEEHFGQLLALCQFFPGPARSPPSSASLYPRRCCFLFLQR